MVVDSLIWANTTVRFDINAALTMLCRFMSNPGVKHAEAMICTIGYLKSSVNRGIENNMQEKYQVIRLCRLGPYILRRSKEHVLLHVYTSKWAHQL